MNNIDTLIQTLSQKPLGEVPFHQDNEYINRIAPNSFPVHMAVHQIKSGSENHEQYCQLHKHSEPEINIILGENLIYEIQIGEQIRTVSGNSVIWIPPDTKHSANLKSGSGQYICVLLSSEYRAEK